MFPHSKYLRDFFGQTCNHLYKLCHCCCNITEIIYFGNDDKYVYIIQEWEVGDKEGMEGWGLMICGKAD